jgi:xanthine dehydrogenase YagR molybdenum-binding subunit
MALLEPRVVGTPAERLDGHDKVTGAARYAFEHAVPDPTYLHPVLSSIARGKVTAMDAGDAQAVDGVVTILTVFDAPRLADTSDGELAILQDPEVHFRGQFLPKLPGRLPT